MGNPLDDLGRALDRGDLAEAKSAFDTVRRQSGLSTQLAAEVIHELRQPLLGIKAYAQMLKQGEHEDPQGALDQLLGQADRMEQIISDFTRIATDKPSAKERINLRGHVLKAQWLFCSRPESAGISVEVDASEDIEIDGNGRLIEQLVLNLLNNAKEAMSGKGRIKLVVTQEGRIPMLYVADWGPGIPNAIRERIFEPYVTSKTHGSGLGLAVCHRIALDHGARIRLAPPYVLSAIPAPSTVFQIAFEQIPSPKDARPRVLVVDDEPVIRMVFHDLLSKKLEVIEAETGEQALELLRQGHYDLIISDKNLPGLSGLDLAKEARVLDPSSRMILMTGYPSLVTAQQAIELGVVDYLVKPFDDIREVREKIRSALAQPPPSPFRTQSRRVDIYEDDPRTARQLTEALTLLGVEPNVLTEAVTGGDELPCGVVVSWDFASAQGRKAADIGRALGRGAPFVVLADHLTMEAAIESLRGGAVACLPKLLSDVKALSRELCRVLKLTPAQA